MITKKQAVKLSTKLWELRLNLSTTTTRKQAVKHSIKLWELRLNVPDMKGKYAAVIYPELYDLQNNCGLCELYLNTSNEILQACADCPIRPKISDYDKPTKDNRFLYDNLIHDLGCNQTCHVFEKWQRAMNYKEKLGYVEEMLKKLNKLLPWYERLGNFLFGYYMIIIVFGLMFALFAAWIIDKIYS